MISKIIQLFFEYWYLGCLIAGYFIYTILNKKTGEIKCKDFESDLSLDQMKKTTKNAHEKMLDEQFTTKRVKGGIWADSENWMYNIQKEKKK